MKETGTIILIFYVFCIGICEAQWTSGGLLLSPDTNHHYRSKQAPHPSGGIYVAWEDITPANDYSIRLVAVDPDGNIPGSWPSGGAKITSEGNHYAPVVCSTSDSCAIVAWYGIIPTHSNNEHIWAQKFSSDGTALWNSGNPVMISQTDTFHHKYPLLAADDNGGAYVTWTRYNLAVDASSPDIKLHHITSNGTLDPYWPVNGTNVAQIQGVREYYPRILVSKDRKKIYIMYAQGLIGGTSMRLKKVYSLFGDLDITWLDGVVLSPGGDVWASLDCEQYLFNDSSDNVVSFWLESKISANGEIYMQKTDSAGNILLSSGGIRVGGTITDGTGYVSIVSDKNSNYFLAYNNYANWYDITAKKIDNSGTQLWFNQWVTNDGNSAYPQITLNENGGIYVFYKRLSPSPTSLYAVSLDAQGEITGGWAVPGSSFGNVGTYNGMFPHRDFCVAAGTSGNAFAVWDRLTGGLYKLYACNLFPSGLNCSPTTQLSETDHAHEIKVFPNPVEQYLNIDCSGIKGRITMQLYSVYGQVVSETMLINGENRICLPELSKGPYIIFIHSDRLTIYQSVILKH